MNSRKLLAGSLLSIGAIVLGLVIGLLPQPDRTVAALSATRSGVPSQPVVARVYYADQADLQYLSAHLDVWEVNRTAHYVVVALNPVTYLQLLAQGYGVEVDAVLTEQLNRPLEYLPGQTEGIPGYLCYRTVEETYATAQSIVSAHPDLAQWIDIGDSWEKTIPGGEPGYDMMVLRLTNFNQPGDKPKFFSMSAIHAREYTTAEINTRLAEYLINNYGSDPDVTWLLDYNEVHLLLQANPDGRKKAETGLSWRKNTNNTYCANTNTRGADLNRNYPFYWGCCGGSSGSACSDTYRGPSAGSEPETQAVTNYVRSQYPDLRADDLNAAAPLTTTGIFMDLHSYSELVLWPWGFTANVAPNGTAMQTLGRKFGYFNNYEPGQSIGLYATDGTTDDFAYGELGLPAYTFEMGTSFFQSCTSFENTIVPANMPALIYAVKATRRPYLTPAGPDVLNATVAPTGTQSGRIITLTATANDTRFNNVAGTEPTQNIAAARYTIDEPSWVSGVTAYPLNAADGSFNSPIESLISTINTAGWTTGRHIIFIESQDAAGNWGVPTAVFVWITFSPDSAITGIVRSGITGSPINGATVQLGGASDLTQTVTGANGVYRFEVYSGTYVLTATAHAHYASVITPVLAATGVTTTQDITLTVIPTGTLHGTVREAATNFPLAASIVVSGASASFQTNSDPATGWYSLAVLSGTYHVEFTAAGHAPQIVNPVVVTGAHTTTLDAELTTQTCVLLVDDDGGRSYESYFTSGLQSTGVKFATWNVATQNSPSAATLQNYPAVVWFTGDDAAPNTLTTADRSNLTAYLNHGGRLLLNGTEIGAGNQNQAFYTVTLASQFTADDSGAKSLTGGGTFAGQSLTLNGPDSANNQDFPDALSPRGAAQRVFTYTNGLGGGVALDTGTYRAINLGFGLEGVQGAAQRAALLRNGLTWLGCAPLAHAWSVSKSASADTIWAGERLTYTLSISHTSAISATGVVITDRLPGGTSFAWASAGGTLSGSEIRWELGKITPTQQLQVQLAVQVQPIVSGTLLVNDRYGLLADQTTSMIGGSPVQVMAYSNSLTVFLPLLLR